MLKLSLTRFTEVYICENPKLETHCLLFFVRHRDIFRFQVKRRQILPKSLGPLWFQFGELPLQDCQQQGGKLGYPEVIRSVMSETSYLGSGGKQWHPTLVTTLPAPIV